MGALGGSSQKTSVTECCRSLAPEASAGVPRSLISRGAIRRQTGSTSTPECFAKSGFQDQATLPLGGGPQSELNRNRCLRSVPAGSLQIWSPGPSEPCPPSYVARPG
ncbi:hypothetical protein XENOCAPTIV_014691 [Xenoophorus captivus]|uniref:Uncharacterized protein n=1 Tax=Xenoophorus captivus TaxID=1517983 RepID=A0ABV0QA01_9TELE